VGLKQEAGDTASFLWMWLLVGVVITGFSVGGYYFYAYFAPKYEGVRYNVYREGPAYNTGMISQLRGYQLQLVNPTVTAEQKAVIYAAIKQQYAEFDPAKLPLDLQPLFIEAMK
jgi:hypothetical protein